MKEGWIYTNIGDCCDIIYGTRVVRARDGGSIYDVYGGSGATFKMDSYNRESCVVIARFAMSKLCTRYVNGKFYLNDSGLTLTPKEGSHLSQILLDKLILALNDDIYKCGRGSAQRNLRIDEFKAIKFAYPREDSEQQRIVDLLDVEFAKIDTLKRNAENQVQAAKELFHFCLKETFGSKVGWIYKTLGDLTTSINGLWKGKKEPFVHVGVIRNANFTKDFTLNYSNIEYLDVEEKQYRTRKLQKGDLIVEKSGGSEKQPVGRTVLFDAVGEFSVSNFTSILRVNNKECLSPEFLYKYLLFIYGEGVTRLMQKATTGIHNIEYDKFLSIPIPLPPLSQQQSIVAHLDALSDRVKALQSNYNQTLTLCNDLKQALLKSIFD